MKKRVLLMSMLTIVLCLTLLVSATFALFTDEDQVNIAITSGNVEYVAEVKDLQAYSPALLSTKGEILDVTNSANGLVFANGGTVELNGKELTLTNMTPGDKVTFDVAITNNSNVKSKYQTVLSVVEESKINEVLVVTINDIKYEGAAIESEWVALDPETNPEVVKVSIELPVEVDNEYKNLTTKLAITVSALQGNVFTDVIDEWDGSESEEPSEDLVIDSAAEFVGFVTAINAGETYSGKTLTLNTSIDLANMEWTPINNFAGIFDGQNHMISNLTANLFGTLSGTVKDLNVKNVNIVNADRNGANGFIGTVAEGGLVDNCSVSDVTITWDAGKGTTDCWGGIISRINGGTVQNCEFANITVTADRYIKRSSAVFAEVGGVISGCTVDGVKLTVADNYSGKGYANQVGGIIADLYDGAEVSDCKFNNIAVVVDEGFNTGGIIGKVGVGGNIEGNTLKNIDVNNLAMTVGNTIVTYAAYSNIGGFIGQVDYRSATAKFVMDNCHITGLDMTVASVKVKEDPSAGFISSLNGNAEITNCSVTGKIDGTNEPLGIGGFLGCVGGHGAPEAGYTVAIKDCKADVAITGNENIFVGGFVAHAGSYNKTMTLTLEFTNCEGKDSFYGQLETGTNEISTFTGCKVNGEAFNG